MDDGPTDSWRVAQRRRIERVNRLLCPLTGTEKQIKYALRLRCNVILSLRRRYRKSEPFSIERILFEDIGADIVRNSRAEWWIENRYILNSWKKILNERLGYYRYKHKKLVESGSLSIWHEICDLYGGKDNPLPNIEFEQDVLGGLFRDNRCFSLIISFLEPSYFCEDLHGRIYEAGVAFYASGRDVTPNTFRDYLGDPDLGGVTLSQYLERLAVEGCQASDILRKARFIHAIARHRASAAGMK